MILQDVVPIHQTNLLNALMAKATYVHAALGTSPDARLQSTFPNHASLSCCYAVCMRPEGMGNN